jgi:hypothetical protein
MYTPVCHQASTSLPLVADLLYATVICVYACVCVCVASRFSAILLVAVYLPQQTDAGTKSTPSQLYKEIKKQETTHPEAALLVAGDFNAVKLKISSTKSLSNLHHLYSTNRDTYKVLPRPPFGKSDHNSIHLIPIWKEK